MVAVEGDFDDCQRLVKSMFAEEEMKTFLGYLCLSFCILFAHCDSLTGNSMGFLSTLQIL